MSHSLYARLTAGLLAAGGLLCSVGSVGTAAAQEKHHHPSHIHHALHELKEARRDLSQAKHDFGGHRAAALKAVDFAIHQLELVVKHHAPANKQGAAQKNTPQHHHPSHIHHALHELKEARHELKNSAHDFGGHRAAALQAVDYAIVQLELVVKHHHKK